MTTTVAYADIAGLAGTTAAGNNQRMRNLLSFLAGSLGSVSQFYYMQDPTRLDLKEMSQNRLAQNELMREFCEGEQISLIDLTAALQAEADAGRNVYFPDESHWNAAGHQLAADAIAAFLKNDRLDLKGSK